MMAAYAEEVIWSAAGMLDLPRECKVFAQGLSSIWVKERADMNNHSQSLYVDLSGSLGYQQSWERALSIDVAVRELPSSKELRNAPGAWSELANHSTIDFLFAYASSHLEIPLAGKK